MYVEYMPHVKFVSKTTQMLKCDKYERDNIV